MLLCLISSLWLALALVRKQGEIASHQTNHKSRRKGHPMEWSPLYTGVFILGFGLGGEGLVLFE